MDSSILVAKDTVVSFHYVLKNKEGEVLDSSAGAEPLTYLHGYKQIVSGLEDALVGKTSGAAFKVTVAPAQGYGERVEEMVISVPKSEWDLPAEVGEGEIVELQSPQGEVIPAMVVEIGEEFVVLDANHPLAGEELYFEIEVTAVRAATAEELAHGHAHGPDGHHHH
jgi:FKBP-type peptidyl-prolyl cis-trans isomerase SlyD